MPLSDEEDLDIVRSNAHVAAWRLLTPFVVLALLAGALVAGRSAQVEARVPAVQARTTTSPALAMKPSDYYLNLAAPLVDMDVSRDGKVPRNRPGEALASGPTNDLQRWWGQQAQKHSGGFPVAARGLAQAEARALQNGNVNPNRFKKAPDDADRSTPDRAGRVQPERER